MVMFTHVNYCCVKVLVFTGGRAESTIGRESHYVQYQLCWGNNSDGTIMDSHHLETNTNAVNINWVSFALSTSSESYTRKRVHFSSTHAALTVFSCRLEGPSPYTKVVQYAAANTPESLKLTCLFIWRLFLEVLIKVASCIGIFLLLSSESPKAILQWR